MNEVVTREATRESYTGWEIAVDLPYRDVVLAELLKLGPSGNQPCAKLGEAEPLLDLGLITLLQVDATTAKIKDYFGPRLRVPDPEVPDVVTIIDGLRLHFSDNHGGWEPRMGLNRNTDTIGGLPHIGTGDWYYPTAKGGVPELAVAPVTSPFGQGVRVGVIDSVLFRNERLTDRWYALESKSILPDAAEYEFLNGHSAFVAGQILSRAPGAKLEIHGVLDGPDSTATVWEVAKAMARFLSIGISVLNLSIGCYTADGKPPFVLERAVEVLASHGIVLLAAAGNHGQDGGSDTIPPNAPIFPAACPGAIAVGALTDHGSGFCRAPYSPAAEWVDLYAPATDVISTYFKGTVRITQIPGLPKPPAELVEFDGHATWSGTSFAAAAVAGEIARFAVPGKKTPQQVLNEFLARDPRSNGNKGIGKYLADIPVCPHDNEE